jgi:hypothetical protein
MLRLLARRIDTAKQLEQQPATIEGLSLLYQRLKAEYDRQRASPSMRLLDEVLTLLEPEGGDQPPLPAALEAGKHAAVARLRAAFGEEGVPVADILGMAAQLATRKATAIHHLYPLTVHVPSTHYGELACNTIITQEGSGLLTFW